MLHSFEAQHKREWRGVRSGVLAAGHRHVRRTHTHIFTARTLLCAVLRWMGSIVRWTMDVPVSGFVSGFAWVNGILGRYYALGRHYA